MTSVKLLPPQSEANTTTPQPVQALIDACRRFAERDAEEPELDAGAITRRVLAGFTREGLLSAPLPRAQGGLGLGIDAGTHLHLLRVLAIAGSADLSVGRILEGHCNALLLLHRYGSPDQLARLADEVHGGMLMGVWNTGGPEPLRLRRVESGFRFDGIKTFATGAAFVRRPIVTAELEHVGWQMTIPRMESLDATIDRSFWQPLGMESSESFQVDFTGGLVRDEELIGAAGDFYREPMFRGGAIRFAAVQAGAVLRLYSMFASWLQEHGRTEDPYQLHRLGEIATLAQECVLWVERAAAVAEQSFYTEEPLQAGRMIECANMMRTAIEEKATRVMRLVTVGVGAHGLLRPHRFEHILRDLTMYLRQPAPDQALAGVGRSSVEKARLRRDGAAWGFWAGDALEQSLPAQYFEGIYRRDADPWQFETSEYEREKYDLTISSLPREQYSRALEVGCSIGVLTARLAGRCDQLLAVDISPTALQQAIRRLAGTAHVQFARMQVPDEMPDGLYDLVVVSEVAYYWSRRELELAIRRLAACQPPGAHLVLVHLTEPVPEYPLNGDAVHEAWIAAPYWRVLRAERRPRFRLEVLERREASSPRPEGSQSPA